MVMDSSNSMQTTNIMLYVHKNMMRDWFLLSPSHSLFQVSHTHIVLYYVGYLIAKDNTIHVLHMKNNVF